MRTSDIVVIGGGLSGLTAATVAARAGLRVTLFEQAREPGGRARTIVESDFKFNLGPHALFRGGAAVRILRDLGVDFHGGAPGNKGAFMARGGTLYAIPSSPRSLLTSRLLGWRGRFEASRFFARLGRINAASLQSVSLREWVKAQGSDEQARDFVYALFRVSTYANDPDRSSAGAGLAQLRMALKGVYYLDGGWQTLVDGLRRAAVQAGARVVSDCKVDAIERNGSAGGVRLWDGSIHEAAAVIAAVAPKAASALIGEEIGRDLIPIRMASFDLALTGLPNPDLWFALGADAPFYFSVHSRWAKLAPESGVLVHAAKYLGPDRSDPKTIERELEQWLDLLQPGWRDHVLSRRFEPNLVVSHALVSTQGRPETVVPGISNLFIAGDWVGPEGMLADAAVASGRQAAEMAVESVRTYNRTSLALVS